MTLRHLSVLINGRHVGDLIDRDDSWAFQYSKDWTDAVDGFDLSPALSRHDGHADGGSKRPVQWYFDNLLPEELLRQVIAREAKLDANDAFGMLAWLGAESAGSLILQAADAPPLQQGLKTLTLSELETRIQQLPTQSLTHDAPKRMSLAGAQHKMLLVLKEGQIYEPLPGTPSTHILKPQHQSGDYQGSVINEVFSMRLAAQMGLEVPPAQWWYTPTPVYVVQRFDRVLQGDEIQRRHVIDACQLLNQARSFKYASANVDALVSTLDYCRLKGQTRQQLYQWLVFNILIGNGDNHLKNLSFLVDAAGIALAPAYDLLSTAASWPDTALAMSVATAREAEAPATFGAVRRAHLLRAGQALGLNATTAERELDRMRRMALTSADVVIAQLQAQMPVLAEQSPQPDQALRYQAREQRVLAAIRNIVIADMVRTLA